MTRSLADAVKLTSDPSAYVTKCKQVMKETKGLAGRCYVVCKSVYDEDLLATVNKESKRPEDELFDAVYFSGSISLMPNPAEALRCTGELLKPNGRLYITQTFQRRGTKAFAMLKPLLKYVTTVDFGQLVYEHQVDKFCSDSGLETIEKGVIPGSIDNSMQAAFVIVLKKKD